MEKCVTNRLCKYGVYFVSRFSTLYHHHCPLGKVTIEQTCKNKPWFTNGYKISVLRSMLCTEHFSGAELKLRILALKLRKIN